MAIVLTGAALTWEIAGFSLSLPAVLNLGIMDIPLAIVVSGLARFIAMFLYFLWGPWWKKEVLVRSGPGAMRGAGAH